MGNNLDYRYADDVRSSSSSCKHQDSMCGVCAVCCWIDMSRSMAVDVFSRAALGSADSSKSFSLGLG